MTQAILRSGARPVGNDPASRARERRRFRRAAAISGLLHAAVVAVLVGLWQPAAETVAPPPIPVTLVEAQEGQSGAAGGGSGDIAASSASAAKTQAATPAPAQTAPAQATRAQTHPSRTQPRLEQPALAEQATEPVPPRKPAPPRVRPRPAAIAEAQPTPPAPPPPPQPRIAEAAPAPAAPSAAVSGARQGASTPLPAGAGGQGRGEAGPGLAETGNGAATGTADDYLGKVRLWILRFAQIPKDDCSQKHGHGWLDVTYMRNGTVLDVKITASSGCPASDAEALRMVRAASPLPPIPARFPGEPKTIGLPFDFRPGTWDRLFHSG